jgi:4a-hydroxytetrahydrobiopterin dehydratase
MEPLNNRRCIPCEGDVEPLTRPEAQTYIEEVPTWQLSEDAKSITREYSFPTFVRAIGFVDRVADLAEFEGHHPDIHLSYTNLKLVLTTHSIKGLSENDFILAAKIENLI